MPTNTEINHCIDEWCHNARHREALKGRMIDGLTNGEIADRMHVDEWTVKGTYSVGVQPSRVTCKRRGRGLTASPFFISSADTLDINYNTTIQTAAKQFLRSKLYLILCSPSIYQTENQKFPSRQNPSRE